MGRLPDNHSYGSRFECSGRFFHAHLKGGEKMKMRKLSTVFAADEPGVGGADHALYTGHLVRLSTRYAAAWI